MMMKKMCSLHMVGWVLVLVGAFNWGLVGAIQFNLVEAILGSWPMVVRVVYVLVGLAAVFALLEGKCKKCKGCCGGGLCKGSSDSCKGAAGSCSGQAE